MAGTVWMTGCQSWYLDATGRNATLWPGYVTSYRLRLRRFRTADYAVVERRIAPPHRQRDRAAPQLVNQSGKVTP